MSQTITSTPWPWCSSPVARSSHLGTPVRDLETDHGDRKNRYLAAPVFDGRRPAARARIMRPPKKIHPPDIFRSTLVDLISIQSLRISTRPRACKWPLICIDETRQRGGERNVLPPAGVASNPRPKCPEPSTAHSIHTVN